MPITYQIRYKKTEQKQILIGIKIRKMYATKWYATLIVPMVKGFSEIFALLVKERSAQVCAT